MLTYSIADELDQIALSLRQMDDEQHVDLSREEASSLLGRILGIRHSANSLESRLNQVIRNLK
jgi:hypothetical protein